MSARCQVVSKDLNHPDDVVMASATSIPTKVSGVLRDRCAASSKSMKFAQRLIFSGWSSHVVATTAC